MRYMLPMMLMQNMMRGGMYGGGGGGGRGCAASCNPARSSCDCRPKPNNGLNHLPMSCPNCNMGDRFHVNPMSMGMPGMGGMGMGGMGGMGMGGMGMMNPM